MRWLLNALYVDFLAAAAPYWLWKVPQARRYRAGLCQRLGFVPAAPKTGKRLWVHAVSVGEASIPRLLVEQFRSRHPDWEVVFSTFTDTGADRLRSLYPDCAVFYWPLDLSFCVAQALDRVQPDAVALVELELWPNFLMECGDRRLPVAIVNGRINPPSVRVARALRRLCPGALDAVTLCCARSDADVERFRDGGFEPGRVHSTGSLKYDALPLEVQADKQDALRDRFALSAGAPVLVAGSTHPGEDGVLCRVYAALRKQHEGLRLILVPRHIERAAAVARTIEAQGLSLARKSELDAAGRSASQDQIILVDTIGDLLACYALATCAFVGRSLLPPGGGQNMMEPAGLAKPVIVGPYNGNFEPEMRLLTAHDAVTVASGEAGLQREVGRLLADPKAAGELARRAREAVLGCRGATGRTLDLLDGMLAGAGLA